MSGKLTNETGELRMIAALIARGYKDIVRAPDRFFPDWDVQTNIGTFEVKQDQKFHKTGNVCIEVWDRGHWSGIVRTKALYFAVVTGDIAHVALTDAWREFLRLNKDYLPFVKCGDDLLAKGFLVSMSLLTPSKIGGLEPWVLPPLSKDYEIHHHRQK